MAADVTEEFLKQKLEEIENNGNQKVCVVGIIGNSALADNGMLANHLVGKEVFLNEQNTNKTQDMSSHEVSIKFFHDEMQRTVYLQVTSINDPLRLLKALQRLQNIMSLTGWYQSWQEIELRHSSALLFLFSVCHIVMVTFPTPRFDLSYIRLFKLLASVRHNMLHNISNILSSIDGLSEIWRTTGRPCIPRIIFAFQIPWTFRGRSGKDGSLKTLQQSLQEQVHIILKKNRLLGSLSSSSLFTVSSPNQTFVHVQQTRQYANDPLLSCINDLWKNSINLDGVQSMLDDRCNSSMISQLIQSPTHGHSSSQPKQDYNLQDFLYGQIDYMMTVESRDVPAEGRRGTHVEAPTASLWYQVCMALHDLFLPVEMDSSIHMKTLAPSLDLDWKFSENRCRKVLPLATNAYLDNLPSHYTQSIHIAQLRQALNIFTLNARGPAFEHFANQLQEDCSQIWWNGRQLCEVHSMTGQPCVYPYHKIPQQVDGLEDKQVGIPCKPHSSRVTSLVACNCGRTQATREDPFDLKSANFSFYEELEKQCCSYLTHLELPILVDRDVPLSPTVAAESPGEGAVSQEDNHLEMDAYSAAEKGDGTPRDSRALYSNLSYSASIKSSHFSSREARDGESIGVLSGQALSFGCLFPTDLSDFRDDPPVLYDPSGSEAVLERGTYSLSRKTTSSDLAVAFGDGQQLPSIAHLDTMLTTDIEDGVLPRFPSWSILVLGSASLYNPSKGIEQPGFFSGSNYLTSWEIPLSESSLISGDSAMGDALPNSMNEASQWPSPGESKQAIGPAMHLPLCQTMARVATMTNDLGSVDQVGRFRHAKGARKGPGKPANSAPFMKAFIGNEYECPRGHRFLSSTPDKMGKSAYPREGALGIVNQDVPLYKLCPCRTSKPSQLAQLMRSYVVTPENHVAIKINPQVQVGTDKDNAEVFFPGVKNGILLPVNSFCVVRYPYVYFGFSRPFLPPMDKNALQTCKLLRGMYSYAPT